MSEKLEGLLKEAYFAGIEQCLEDHGLTDEWSRDTLSKIAAEMTVAEPAENTAEAVSSQVNSDAKAGDAAAAAVEQILESGALNQGAPAEVPPTRVASNFPDPGPTTGVEGDISEENARTTLIAAQAMAEAAAAGEGPQGTSANAYNVDATAGHVTGQNAQ